MQKVVRAIWVTVYATVCGAFPAVCKIAGMSSRVAAPNLAILASLAILTSPWVASGGAQQASGSANTNRANLAGRWRFSSYGSFWTVDLKLDSSKSTSTEKVYCGEAARDRTMPDTPIIKSRLCAEIDPDDGQLRVEVSGATCKAPWQTVGTLEGTCSRGHMPMVTHADDDLPSGGTMTMPMGGFTAVRVQTTGKNNK